MSCLIMVLYWSNPLMTNKSATASVVFLMTHQRSIPFFYVAALVMN